MTIKLEDVSKRYTTEWILKNINITFSRQEIYGIRGSNGSGKSTLVKMLSGYLSPSVGQVRFYGKDEQEVSRDEIFRYVSMWGPHVGLIPQLTVSEMIDYYFTFKDFRPGINANRFNQLTQLSLPRQQRIESLSSGQAQRLGLALTILCDSEILLLDEPGSFLDQKGLDWFANLFRDHCQNRLCIVSSNEADDLALATQMVDIERFK